MSDPDGLAALGGMTQEADAANPGQAEQAKQAEQQQQAEQADQGAKEWGLMMFTIGGLATLIAPELQPVYTQERCFQWGQHCDLVCRKYGITSGAMPELALIGSTIGFVVPTWLLVSQKLKEAKDNSPKGWLAKAGLWFRTRGARKAATAPPAPPGDVVSEQ